jgi:hypothetical protein
MTAQSNNDTQNGTPISSRKRSDRPGTPGAVKIQRKRVTEKPPTSRGKYNTSPAPRHTERTPAPNRPATTATTPIAATVQLAASQTPPQRRNETSPPPVVALAASPTTAGETPSATTAQPVGRPNSEPSGSAAGSGPGAATATVTALTSAATQSAPQAAGSVIGDAPGTSPTRRPDPHHDRTSRAGRLRSGQLRALVAQTLAARPHDQFTVTQLSNMLRRSPGAISNAAEKLREQGLAVRTQQHPKTYQSAQDGPSS